jgi:hypothetical protein
LFGAASNSYMCLTAILAALLVAPLLSPLSPALSAPLPRAPNCRDAACRVSGSESAQAAPGNPQLPEPDQAPTEPQQSESNPAQTPPAKEAGKPSPEKPPGSRSATGTRKRRSRTHKPGTATPDGEPRKTVVHQGGASEPIAQILPGITQEEASHQRENAEQLLAATESNLKQLASRTLKPNQQEMAVQTRHYMDGARLALKESDTQRAHTLALKAYLLSDDLMKH